MKKVPLIKVQDFLNEAFLILKDGKVKKFAPTTLASKTGAQPSVATVCGPDFMGIYQTDEQGLYFWNAAYRPDEALAEKVLEENNAYHRMLDTKRNVEHINEHDNGQNAHPYRLNDVWQSIGYTRFDVAKRALIQEFKENDDYIISRNDAENSNGFTGLSAKVGRPEEIIYITEECLGLFAANAQTNIGKAFNRTLIKGLFNKQKNLLAHKMVSERIAHDMDLIEEIRDIAAQALRNKSLNLRDHLNGDYSMAHDKDGLTYNPKNGQYVAIPQEYSRNETALMKFSKSILDAINPDLSAADLTLIFNILFPKSKTPGDETQFPNLRLLESKAS